MWLQDNKINLLLIDDDEDDFIILSDYLKDIPSLHVKVDWCSDYHEALQHMCSRKYDIYLIDYRLGIKSGLDLLSEAINNNCEEPVIMLTGFGNYEIDNQAMRLGAADYLIKSDLSWEKIERSIRYALERTATLKLIRESERKYRSVFEKSRDVIFIGDEQLIITDINNELFRMLEYTQEECVGKMSLYDFLSSEADKEHLQKTLLEVGEIDDWEVVLNSKSGEKKSCYFSAVKQTDIAGNIYVQGIIHDITNLKKSEKATLQAEKSALVGRLVQTLAHEVRNPLNNISLSLEQIESTGENTELQPYISIIDRNAKRINALITELLQVSKPAEVALHRVTIQQVIDDVVAESLDRITLKKIELDLDHPDTPLYISGNRKMLAVAILNIVINALEAMDEGNGHLSIRAFPKNDLVVLAIKDNGCGISEEHIAHLFEPYFTSKRNGMGLGLASSLNVLQAHKAEVEVSSLQNEGTIFTLTFPLHTSSVIQPS
ncbi:MAG TPA: ATP-binding protein [Flavipsychrobacter sp.]